MANSPTEQPGQDLHLVVVGPIAEGRADEVEDAKAARREFASPIFGRLLIDMMLTALMRDRRREEDDVAVADDVVDKQVGLLLRQMLGDLERNSEVKSAVKPERLFQISRNE